MKKHLILGLVVVGSLLVVPFTHAKEKKVVVATAGDFRSFSFEKKGQLTGYDIEVLKATDELMDDYRFSFKKTSWESIFVGLDSGHYQVAANNLSYTKERADKYLYFKPIATNSLVLISLKDAKVKHLKNIGGLTTQDDTGASTAKLVIDWNKKHKDNPLTIDYSVEDVSKGLLDLDNGEFDYLIFDKISVKTIIKQKNLEFYVTKLKSQDNTNNYIISSDDQKDLQKSFNKALEKLQKSGKLEKISRTYLGGNYLASRNS